MGSKGAKTDPPAAVTSASPERKIGGIVGGRKRGRPVAPVRSVNIGTWLPEHDADRLIQIARRQDRSVASLIHQILIVGLKLF